MVWKETSVLRSRLRAVLYITKFLYNFCTLPPPPEGTRGCPHDSVVDNFVVYLFSHGMMRKVDICVVFVQYIHNGNAHNGSLVDNRVSPQGGGAGLIEKRAIRKPFFVSPVVRAAPPNFSPGKV